MSRTAPDAPTRTARAALAYFVLVFGAGFILGSISVPFLVQRLGESVAELIEMTARVGVDGSGLERKHRSQVGEIFQLAEAGSLTDESWIVVLDSRTVGVETNGDRYCSLFPTQDLGIGDVLVRLEEVKVLEAVGAGETLHLSRGVAPNSNQVFGGDGLPCRPRPTVLVAGPRGGEDVHCA